jgi:hypothetical protein
LAGFRIVTRQFGASLLTDGVNPLPIWTEDRTLELHGSGGQLHWFPADSLEQARFLADDPEVAVRVENEILSVSGPGTATVPFTPIRKQTVRFVPSLEISQIEMGWDGSWTSKRILLPSGDQLGLPGVPVTTHNLLTSAPSLLATCSS